MTTLKPEDRGTTYSIEVHVVNDGKSAHIAQLEWTGGVIAASAKCAPEDKFDKLVGDRLAALRALSQLIEEVHAKLPADVQQSSGVPTRGEINRLCKRVAGLEICVNELDRDLRRAVPGTGTSPDDAAFVAASLMPLSEEEETALDALMGLLRRACDLD